MPVKFEESQVASSASPGAQLQVDSPGMRPGLLIIAAMCGMPTSGPWNLSLPDGFTTIFSRLNSGSDVLAYHLGAKIADSAEPNKYQFQFGSSTGTDGRVAAILTYSGELGQDHKKGEAGVLTDVTPPVYFFSGAAPSVVTTIDNALILRFGFISAATSVGTNHFFTGTPVLSNRVSVEAAKRAMVIAEEIAPITPPGATAIGDLNSSPGSGQGDAYGVTIAIAPDLGGGEQSGTLTRGRPQVRKADVLAAREAAKAIGAKIRTKFDPRTRR